MADLKEKLISNQTVAGAMSQKLPLQVEARYDTFAEGDKLLAVDLQELGLEEDTNHMKIDFDNEKSAKYCFCKVFIIMLSTVYGFPVFLLTFPCIWSNTKVWAQSRLAAVTGNKLVLKEGYYGCCCCCWNEKTKSVPLDKITDLRLEQGCIQRCFDIRGIVVETASSAKEKPEMSLIGLYKPRAVRSMILKVRDNHGLSGISAQGSTAPHGTGYNPLLASKQSSGINTKALQDLMTKQKDTMVEIKDVLQDMKTALISMDNKMSGVGVDENDTKTDE